MAMNFGAGYNYYQPTYNALQNTQQRLSQLEAQYNQPTLQSPSQGIRALLVTNKEEATACQIPLDGTPTIFYNKAQNEIYIKQISMQTGLPEFQQFVLSSTATTNKTIEDSICKKDITALSTKIDSLYDLLTKKDKNKKGEDNAK